MQKEPEFYRPLFGDVPDDLPYVWPDPTFPRWPVRRTSEQPLDLEAALTLLGLAEAPAAAEEVVGTLRAGRDVRARCRPPDTGRDRAPRPGCARPAPPSGSSTCRRLERVRPAPTTREGTGSLSPSVAREPTEADRIAMADEASGRPGVPLRPQRARHGGRADALAAGLVVAPAAADPGPELHRPRLLLP